MPSFLRSKLATVGLVALVLWFGVLAGAATLRRASVLRGLENLDTRIADSQRENARLADELERMKRPQWLALLARQQLNYKQPDETVVFVYKSEKADTIAQPKASEGVQPSHMRLWFDWFRGRMRD